MVEPELGSGLVERRAHSERETDWRAFNDKRSGINPATGKRWTKREVDEAVRRSPPSSP